MKTKEALDTARRALGLIVKPKPEIKVRVNLTVMTTTGDKSTIERKRTVV